MRDPYDILGVPKTATPDQIKSAYRKLAKKHHPDLNPGRKDAEQKFKEAVNAHDLLTDPVKRARYDRGEIDEMGNERAFSRGYGGGHSFGNGRGGRRTSGSFGGRPGEDPFSQFGGVEDILAEFMGAAQGRRGGAGGPGMGGAGAAARGGDMTYTLTVTLPDACLGSKQRVALSNGRTIDITIPPGTADGHKLRLRGQGHSGPAGAGDAIIEIHIEPHPYFKRKDNDILLDVPISVPEAVSGASIKVPTLDGSVTVKVPQGANSGAKLRLKGKGVPAPQGDQRGDMFVRLSIMLPDPLPDDFKELIEKWAKKRAYDPRKKLGW
ncbi:MAG: DnaJ C-terminal domain-containing protein [Bdellovibrionales bacterium]